MSIAITATSVFAMIFCIFAGILLKIFPTIFVTKGCTNFINNIATIPQTILKLKVILPFRFKNSPV